MTPWEDFYPYAVPHLPGCPEVALDAALREAAAEFCARSRIWREDIECFTARGERDMPLDAPPGAVPEDVTALFADGFRLSRAPAEAVPRPLRERGRPASFALRADFMVRFFPEPSGRFAIEGEMVLKPSLKAGGVADWIFETHGRPIASGALWRLAMVPGKEWSSPALASFHRGEAERGADDARGRDGARAGRRAKPVGFEAATRRRS